MKREGHPTIKNGQEGVGIIDKFSHQFVQPIIHEGFSEVISVTTEDQFNEVVLKLSQINL
jgi:hypothetical protein